MTIILHVGAGKCGSSSLQAHMSNNPLFSADDASAHYEYVCITRDGNLLRGEEIGLYSRMSPYGCQVSAGADAPWAAEEAALERLSTQLRQVIAQGRTPVASQECWLRQAWLFTNNETLPRLGVRAKVVAFVRPQVPYLISSWWQWGVWVSPDFPKWVEEGKRNHRWTAQICPWQSAPGVDSVEVYTVDGDVVATFLGSLGVTIENSERRNIGLDANLLNYLRRRKDLRSMHNPVVEFILQQRLAPNADGTPWLLEHDKIAELIAFYREDNLKLLSLLSGDARRAMEQDPHWWDPAAYSSRKAVPAELPEPSVAALDDICTRAIDAVIKLDGQVRVLEQTQRELNLAWETSNRELFLAKEEVAMRERAAEAARCDLTAEAAMRERTAEEATRRAVAAALEAERRKRIGPRLRKAISINGIRRLVGSKRAAGSAARLQ